MENTASTPRPELQFAKASLNHEGNFEISFIPLRPDRFAGLPDPDEFYRLKMTKTIFYRLMQLCKQHNIFPIFAQQTGAPDDEVMRYARQIGYTVVDMSLNLDEDDGYKYRLRPYDMHPNQRAHRYYKDHLLPTVRHGLAQQLQITKVP